MFRCLPLFHFFAFCCTGCSSFQAPLCLSWVRAYLWVKQQNRHPFRHSPFKVLHDVWILTSVASMSTLQYSAWKRPVKRQTCCMSKPASLTWECVVWLYRAKDKGVKLAVEVRSSEDVHYDKTDGVKMNRKLVEKLLKGWKRSANCSRKLSSDLLKFQSSEQHRVARAKLN